MKVVVMSLAALAAGSCLERDVPPRRGPFAFHYSPKLSEAQLRWYSQFDLLVTHDPLPPAQAARLRAAGTRLVIYEWAVAFYESRATPWQRSLMDKKASLLNDRPLTGGAGSETSGAWYFDPATDDHETARAAELARMVRTIGYDGVFFDTTTIESVHPAARAEYEKRHEEAYDAAYARFLARLRKEMPNGIIFTNQGYRSPEHYLPHADWDLTESLITRPVGGKYVYRPWNDPKDPWNSIHFLMRNLIGPVAARYPKVRFGHLNYASDDAAEIARVVTAVSQIFGAAGFVAATDVESEIDPVYFGDPGAPVSGVMDHADGNGSHRIFEHGIVAVRFGAGAVTIPNTMALRDRFSGAEYCGGKSVTLPTGSTPRAFFLDRISDCG